jgi:O-antigen/teichoic acid export membrane protein
MNFLGVTTGDVGRYNIAYMFGNVVQSVGMASGLALGPLMNERYARKDDVGARNLVFVLQISFFFATFILCLWLREVFSIMIRNPDLSQMYPLGIIIIMGYNYRPMYFGANNALFFAEKTNLLWRVTLVAGLINVGLNFATIPIFGYQAAGVTTYIALMYMGYAGYYFKVFRQVNSAEYYPMRWLLGTIALTAAAYFLRDVPWTIKSIITFVSVAIVAILYMSKRSSLSS